MSVGLHELELPNALKDVGLSAFNMNEDLVVSVPEGCRVMGGDGSATV